MLPIASRAGNDRNASPGELDFMHGGMTRGMKAHVSTMLTEKRLEYCIADASLQWPMARNHQRNTTNAASSVFVVLSDGPAEWRTDK